MTDRPILMNGAMVRAVLEGRKTQTRRVVKGEALRWLEDGFTHEFVADYQNRLCPYGQPGDRLWVREAWSVHKNYDALKPALVNVAMGGDTRSCINYHATKRNGNICGKARPSIHMPRWASRITLEITGVRVERLNDISEADAKAEGVSDLTYMMPRDTVRMAQWHFRDLWESINGQGSWEANPWVWVVEFKRVTP